MAGNNPRYFQVGGKGLHLFLSQFHVKCTFMCHPSLTEMVAIEPHFGFHLENHFETRESTLL